LYSYTIFSPFYLGAFTFAGAIFLEVFLGIPRYEGAAVMGLLAVVFSASAGLMAGGIMGAVAWILGGFSFLAVAGFLFAAIGGPAGFMNAATKLGIAGNLLSFGGLPSTIPFWLAICGLIMVEYAFPNFAGLPMYFPWTGSASWCQLAVKDDNDAVMSFPWFYTWFQEGQFLLILFPSVLGAVMFPAAIRAEPTALVPKTFAVLPSGLLGLAVAGLLLANLMGQSGFIIWTPPWLIEDVYRRFFKPGASDTALIRGQRLAMLGIIVLGYVYAMVAPSMLSFTLLFYTISAVGIGVSAIGQYFWYRWNGYAECAMIFLGLPVVLILQYLVPGIPTFPDLAWLANAIMVGIWLIFGLAFPAPPEDVLIDFYRKVRPIGFWGPIREKLAVIERQSAGGF
jgi:Na+/proline symporter